MLGNSWLMGFYNLIITLSGFSGHLHSHLQTREFKIITDPEPQNMLWCSVPFKTLYTGCLVARYTCIALYFIVVF